MLTANEHFLSLAQFTYILSGLFFAVLRGFHFCRPYDKHKDYYYPSWRESTLFYAATLLLMPYVFRPSSPAAWLLTKVYFIVYVPYVCGVLIYKYFSSVKQRNRWSRESIILGIPIALTILALFIVAIIPHTPQLSPTTRQIIFYILLAESIASLLFALSTMQRVRKWMSHVIDDNYSNEEDFPVKFANRMLFVPPFHLLLIWPVVLCDSQVGMAIVHLLLAMFNVTLLVMVLHPQRSLRDISTVPVLDDDEPPAASGTPSQQTIKAIERTIRSTVETEQLFINPHFSMQDVVERSGFGRTYVSWVFKNRLGGFFNYVNRLRIDYAERYRKQHPMATLDEVATASGFTTRQSYYRVRQRLKTKQTS